MSDFQNTQPQDADKRNLIVFSNSIRHAQKTVVEDFVIRFVS